MPFLLSTQEQLANRRDDSKLAHKLTMTHVDTCLSCFVQDHHNRDGECLFGVYVDGNSTVQAVKDGLKDEIRQSGDRVPDPFQWEDMFAAVDATFDGADMGKLFDASLEVPDEDDEDGESCQAWFVLSWEIEDGAE